MQTVQINRNNTGLFSIQQLDLSYNQDRFIPFINTVFSKEAFEDIADAKSQQFTKEQRNALVEALRIQHNGLNNGEKSLKNIEALLNDNAFTITTGHQLSAFTGPLYFIYKILHVIKQCEELNASHPDYHFIPVYWLASEDHDYEEVKSFQIFSKTLTWETEQKGPVGKFDLTGWNAVMTEVKELFSNHPNSEIHQLIESFQGKNYAEAFRKFVHTLFHVYGLVIVDGDDAKLKKLFAPIIKQELNTQFSLEAVEKTNEELEREGLKVQIHTREINLFYCEKGIRERIIKFDDRFEIEGKGTFTMNELLKMVDENPELFSPNVVLRPVYQETILPNVCYVGGAGEISYWLQLKRVFDAAGIQYPLIQVRNSVLWIDAGSSDKIEKLHYSLDAIFQDVDLLKKRFVEENSEEELDFSELDKQFESLKKSILDSVISVEPNLESYGIAETVRIEKQLTGIKDKLYRQSKSRHEKSLKMIDQIKDRLFPGGGMQERKVNFFQLTPDGNYTETLDFLKNSMQPFSGDLIVVQDKAENVKALIQEEK